MNCDPSMKYDSRLLVVPLTVGTILLASACENVVKGGFTYHDGKAEREVYKAKDKPETSNPDDTEKGGLVHTEYFRCEKNENGLWEVVKEEDPVDGPRAETDRYFSKVCHDGTLEFPDIS